MPMRFRLLAIIATLAIFSAAAPLAAQRNDPTTTPPKPVAPARALDTVYLAYDFEPGESVTYRVMTYDSLVLYGANTMRQTAERTQIVTFTCDSVTFDGFVMTMRYDRYVAREWRDSLPAVTRTSHPFVDRPFTFLVSPDGRRIRHIGLVDPPAVAPAGPFQPLLLPYLGEPWTWIGSSQLFELNHFITDHAAPAHLWSGSAFRSVLGRDDTMGLKTVAVTLAETARARHETSPGVTTTAIINGESTFWFAPLLGFPVAGRSASIVRLELATDKGMEATGRQILSTTFEMIPQDEALLPHDDGR